MSQRSQLLHVYLVSDVYGKKSVSRRRTWTGRNGAREGDGVGGAVLHWCRYETSREWDDIYMGFLCTDVASSSRLHGSLYPYCVMATIGRYGGDFCR